MNDPLLEFKDLFETNWNAANTVLSSAPYIHTGWYENGSDEPQLTITSPEEQEATGSPTGWTGIGGDGSGPTRQVDGTAYGNVWCNENQSAHNPKQVVWDLRQEALRIVFDNVESTQWQFIALGEVQKIVEDDQDPVMHRYELPLGYYFEQGATV